MPPRIAFDNDRYLAEQTAAILERVAKFGDKLYLEFGGKLLFDYHAARVLPGFDPNVKVRLLQQLRDKSEVLLCISAGDIERKKMRADFGITYDADAMKLIDDLRARGITVTGVIITRCDGQPSALLFKNRLERRNVRVVMHRPTKGYPVDVDTVVSDEGYGANEYIPTTRPIVVVTGPGPLSGKLATCLSQLYHDWRRGIRAGYAKFETFPIWSLPLKHPVNLAYEAATADIKDFNLIDPFHLEAYNARAVNYNRDVEAFPLLRRIIEKITGAPSFYMSPTDRGVNRAGYGIVDDVAVRAAATQEVIRRYLRYSCEYAMGVAEKETVQRAELLMKELGVTPEDRHTVVAARQAARDGETQGKGNEGVYCGAALQLADGTMITGKNSPEMHSAAALILNAVKHLAGLPSSIHLLPPAIISSLTYFKREVLQRTMLSLDLEETLIALSFSATSNPAAGSAIEQLKALRGCEVHLTHIPPPGDEAGLRKLGVNLTSDPHFVGNLLFQS
ncbi:MAG TPA: DUF1846 domain-containing protein [Bacteroidota bacterium]|nr:DUF1846 domain-containing protein [Bacteroidota bacterium]